MQFSDALDLYQKTNILIRFTKPSYLLMRTLSNNFIWFDLFNLTTLFKQVTQDDM